MKVLFLTYCYPPQKYPRSIQISHLVQYLRKEFPLEVITAPTESKGDLSLLSFTPLDNVLYAKKSFLTRFIEKSRGDKIKRALLPDPQYLWHFDLYRKSSQIILNSEVTTIMTFGQPMSTHIAGLKLKKKFPNLTWIAHFSDPWVDNPFNDDNFWSKFINKYYQNAVFQKADKLIFTSEEAIDLVTKNYPPSLFAKSLCLPHCFNEDLYPRLQPQKAPLAIRYLGNFYGERQPDSLFKALKALPKNIFKDIRIELVGGSTEALEDLIKSNNLQTMVFTKAPVDYLESLKLMEESDLLLIIDASFENSPFLPSKLIDYIGANKPIFGITPSGTSQKLIEEMGFLVAHPKNPQEISEKLIQIIESIRSGKELNIPASIRNRYSINTVGAQFSHLLHKINP
ncbi:MAG TPA: glycosyltransferase [Alphaproteobacteria bacterium]|nr:glycosyltransferase [Alphaproteobacteria bacterium]HQS93036.1 glycosyltransferase [Alphaproteobacteria bacterium]